MRGYPKGQKNKQDFDNLLSMSEHREQALKELEEIRDLDDSTIEIDVTPADAKPEDERVIELIENPMPLCKRLGFADRDSVAATITAVKGEAVIEATEEISEISR